MELSSWPARPTKGSPWRSSSAPGASPTIEPFRLLVAYAENGLSSGPAQRATSARGDPRARSSAQSTPGFAGRGLRATQARLVRISGRRQCGLGQPARRRPRAPSLRSRARRDSRGATLGFMRLRRARACAGAVCDTPTPAEPTGHNRRTINSRADRPDAGNEDERERHQHDVREAHSCPGIHLLEAVEGESADHERAGDGRDQRTPGSDRAVRCSI